MKTIKAKYKRIAIMLRLLLLAAFLILPLSSTVTANAGSTEVGSVSGSFAPDANASVAAALGALPRSETLYFNGLQWGSVAGWNPYSSQMNNSMAIAQQDNSRVVMFETPYMYNMIDGNVYPLLADGDYTWNAERTAITFNIKAAAHWSDGTPVTAEDVAYTWAANAMYGTDVGFSYEGFIETIEAVGPQTVRVTAKVDMEGDAINPLMVSAYLSSAYVIQKSWTQTLEARTGGNADAFRADPAEDVIASGPYKKYYRDNTKVVLIRDAHYWGQDASMWGKLPAPKYLAHVIYPDDNASLLALRAGKVDVSQQFNANVQDLWLVDHLPVSTYYPDAPYGIGASLPTAFYNLNAYGLDQVAVRKAIAMAVDYDSIVADAMTNQSPTFTQVPRSIMNPTAYEQTMYDHAAVASLQWAGNDVAGANTLLDAAGITDTDSDGWREYNGQKLSYVATCPNGWTDWQAAIEVLAAVGQQIGIEITTNYPEWSEYQTVVTNSEVPFPPGYDIFMMWTEGAGPTQPWGRIRKLISSEWVGWSSNWNGNWGGYVNPAADDLIRSIPAETDPAALKAAYTQLTEIYLTDIPSFTLMYRPQSFHTVSELVWTGFPKSDDGTSPPVPPLDLIDGYGVAGLYNLTHGPSLLSPAKDENVPNLRPTFDWGDMPGATGYTIQISTSNTFEIVAQTANPVESTYTPVVNLPKGDLYWRVRSIHANGPSTWSPARSYQGPYPPAAPTLTLPAKNALVQDLTPFFKWSVLAIPAKAAPFDKYQLQVATDSGFTSIALEQDVIGLNTNFFTPTIDFDPNTTYYWRVRGVNSLPEYGAWSASWTFRTALLPPVLTALPNSDHPYTLRPTFGWNDPNLSVPLASSYTIQIAATNKFTTLIHSGTAPAGASSYTPKVNLPAGKLLYWRVRANGLNGPSLWATRTFTTPRPPSTATLLLPANGSLNINYTPTLKWSIVSVASSTVFDHYQVQVDDDPLFGSPAVDEVNLTLKTQNSLTTPPLPHNTKFYWRVLAFNNLGQYSTSAVWTIPTRVDAPVLVSPAHETAAGTLKPTFVWNAPSGPGTVTGYTIQISISPTFGTLLVNSSAPNPTYTAVKNLPAAKTLYWRVKVNGANGPSAWSGVYSFTTP